MRRVLFFVFLGILLALPVRALELEAPPPPEAAAELLPKEADSFGEGLWNVLTEAGKLIAPSMAEAAGCCLRVFAVVLLAAMTAQLAPGTSKLVMELAGTAAAAVLLLEPAGALISLGVETVRQLRDYGKLLLGVMASALAARGGVGASTALYAGTAFFDAVLGAGLTAVFLPMLRMYLALAIAHSALGDAMLERFKGLLRWAMEWSLKLTLYLFTGYMAVTGVVSGTADAAAGKAARIAISGAVPVVGGILSDAADAVVLSAATLGGGAGIWGILTVLAMFCTPVIRIGCQYLLLKVTAAVGQSVNSMRCADLAADFAGAMGLLMALVSTQAVLLLISTVCFLRGVGG